MYWHVHSKILLLLHIQMPFKVSVCRDLQMVCVYYRNYLPQLYICICG